VRVASTHSFTNISIIHSLSLSTTPSSPLIVTTASGTQMSTTILCPNLTFSLHYHVFSDNFQVLQVAGINLILGMDWIHTYSPIELDCHLGTLSLHFKGVKITLTVQPDQAIIFVM
jgi:Retroviral aspartyl protease